MILRALGTVAVASFVGLLAYGLAARGADTTIDDALARGELPSAHALRLPPLVSGGDERWRRAAADGLVDLGELRGAPVVVNFWASWCEPCEAEAPVLREGAERASRAGALVLGLNQQDHRAKAREFIAKHGLRFPHVRDRERGTADEWGTTGLPETFFITAGGRVAAHVVGAIDRADFDAGLEAALDERALAPRAGGVQGGTR